MQKRKNQKYIGGKIENGKIKENTEYKARHLRNQKYMFIDLNVCILFIV